MNFKRALIAGLILLVGTAVANAAPSQITPVSKTVKESGIGTFNINATMVGKLAAVGITAAEGDVITAVGVSWKVTGTSGDYFDCGSFMDTVSSGTVLGCLNGTNPLSNWDAAQLTVGYQDASGNPLPFGGPVTTALDRAVLTANAPLNARHVDVVHIVHPADQNLVFNSGIGGTTTLAGNCGNADCPDYPIDVVEAQVETGSTVRFLVTKNFLDNNEGTVSVSIACNTGLILEEGFEIGDGEQVEFVVENFKDEVGFWCEITEDPADGYIGEFTANGELQTPPTGEEGSCYYTAGPGGNLYSQNYCSIVNEADFVDIKIAKEWVIGEGGASDQIDTNVYVKVTSAAEIEGGSQSGNTWSKTVSFIGTSPATQTVGVRPDWKGSSVVLMEGGFDSSTEVDNSCGTGTTGGFTGIKPGDAARTCTFTNTVFFEGIPTLSQYGMAIMALLMLGMGFVGFRRFV